MSRNPFRSGWINDEARNAFTLTYDDRLDPEADQWEECSRVLSRRDIEEEMDKGW